MNISLFLDRIKTAVQKRTGSGQGKPGKSYDGWLARGYRNEPTVSIIMQSHNKSLQILHVVEKLRQRTDIEIIVIDDGSDMEHTKRLAEALSHGYEFLVRANDLYENVTYDRTIRMANGRYVALLQDDDDFDSLDWIDRAISLFEAHPQMAILGGKDGLHIAFEEDTKYAHGGAQYTLPAEGFCFVTAVNRAPMWLNRSLFLEHLKHIDFSFAPFQFDDYELCARAWLCNLQVGWYDAAFHSLSVGGMRLWNNAFTKEQSARNGARLYEMYHDRAAEIQDKIDQLN